MARLPRMITTTEGLEGVGKSDWALRGTPRPCTFLDFDFGVEGIGGPDSDKLMKGVNVISYDPFGTVGYDIEEDKDRQKCVEEIERFKKDWRKAINDKVPLLVVDTLTLAWKAQRVAYPQETWAKLESEFHGLVRAAYISPHTSLILIHHLKADWMKDSKGSSFPSGTYSRDGLNTIGTMVQLGIRQHFAPPTLGDNNVVVRPGKREYSIVKCRDNAALTGTRGPLVDWVTLCTLVAPKVDWAKVAGQ